MAGLQEAEPFLRIAALHAAQRGHDDERLVVQSHLAQHAYHGIAHGCCCPSAALPDEQRCALVGRLPLSGLPTQEVDQVPLESFGNLHCPQPLPLAAPDDDRRFIEAEPQVAPADTPPVQGPTGWQAGVDAAMGRVNAVIGAVFLVVGRQDKPLPESLLALQPLIEPGQTLTSKLGGSETFLAMGDPLHWSAMLGLALLLLGLVLAVTVAGARLEVGFGRGEEEADA